MNGEKESPICESCHGTGDAQPHAVIGHQDEKCRACGGTGRRSKAEETRK